MKPYIHHAFWSDEEVEGQPPEIKLCALWILTNSQRSILGICQATTKRFVFETGLDAGVLVRVCEALPGMLIRVGSAIFIRGFIRHQFGAGEKLVRNNFFKALRVEFSGLRNADLRGAILEEYPEFEELQVQRTCDSERNEGLIKPLPRAIQAQGKERTGKERKEGGAGGGSTPNLGLEHWKETLRADHAFCDAFMDWQRHLAEKEKTMTRMQRGAVLMECARQGPHRAVEVIRFSISKGAVNLIWDDAPRSKATRKQAKGPEPDPAGWPEWMAGHYPEKAGTPYADTPESVQAEFRRCKPSICGHAIAAPSNEALDGNPAQGAPIQK